MPPRSRTLIAHLAGECSRKTPDPERIAQLREQVTEAKAEEYITRLLATAPPLSAETRCKLAALLVTPRAVGSVPARSDGAA